MQVVLNMVVASSTLALMAVGFGLIFSTTRFFHFAHAVVYTGAAYLTYCGSVQLGLPVVVAALLGVAGSVCFGGLMEVGLYRNMRRWSASALTLLIASVGAYVVLQNLISIIWGDDVRMLQSSTVREGMDILGGRITPTSVLATTVCVALLAVVTLVLGGTGLGRAMRAVADDAELARIRGIRVDRVILATFAIGSGLAAVAGILVALDVNMRPTMGMSALMLAIVAVIIGGVSSIGGIVLGSLFLAAAQQVAIWQLGSQWQDAVAFAILLVFLLVRPQGLFGKPLRKVAV
ncbi:MAG: branched-chain amino acid ABC transporter permease [Phycisphaerae bacterium]|nr:branched-chain amino acid ABC transporter permease [Phycisphaerae bacterium]